MESWVSIGLGSLSLGVAIFFGWGNAGPRNRRYMRALAARVAIWGWFAFVFCLCLWILGRYLVGDGVPTRSQNFTAMLYTCVLFIYVLLVALGPTAVRGARKEEAEKRHLRARVAALEASSKSQG